MASTMVALQTVTVGAGGSASISFTSIPQTYTDLKLVISPRNTAANNYGTITFNGSSSSFSRRILYGTGSSTASTAPNNAESLTINDSGTTASTFANYEMYIPNYASSNYKSFSIDSVTENNGTVAYQIMHAGVWSNTAAITSLTITAAGGNLAEYSTATLYGVYKDAAETTPAAPTIGTATAGSQAADVAFTPAGSGAPASSYIVTSSPGGLTATGGSSPIQIGGLTSGTAYTFTVAGQNPGGVGASSAASNSVTPYDGYESIATAYGSGGSTITFSSIPSTYTHLQLRVIGKLSGSVGYGQAYVQFNGDTAANYSAHQLYGTGSSAASGATVSATKADVTTWFPDSTTANMFGASVTDILDYANTNKYKTIRVLGGFDTNNTNSGLVGLFSSSWRSTAAVSSMSITAASNFLSGTVFELFGIRG